MGLINLSKICAIGHIEMLITFLILITEYW